MRSGIIFAVIVLIVMLFAIAFSSLTIYYIIRLRNGNILSSGQINAILYTNIVLLILSIMILIWAIFVMASARRGAEEVIETTQGPIIVKEQATITAPPGMSVAEAVYDSGVQDREVTVVQRGCAGDVVTKTVVTDGIPAVACPLPVKPTTTLPALPPGFEYVPVPKPAPPPPQQVYVERVVQQPPPQQVVVERVVQQPPPPQEIIVERVVQQPSPQQVVVSPQPQPQYVLVPSSQQYASTSLNLPPSTTITARPVM